ncbi:hypothetical protein D3C84_866620 [compost metagenome]
MIPRPTGRHPQPATALFAVVLSAVPMEFDFDATVFIAVDLFPDRPGDAGGLADEHGALCGHRRPIKHVPGNRAEAVLVALGKTALGVSD